jgi:hypothetical protein
MNCTYAFKYGDLQYHFRFLMEYVGVCSFLAGLWARQVLLHLELLLDSLLKMMLYRALLTDLLR